MEERISVEPSTDLPVRPVQPPALEEKVAAAIYEDRRRRAVAWDGDSFATMWIPGPKVFEECRQAARAAIAVMEAEQAAGPGLKGQ